MNAIFLEKGQGLVEYALIVLLVAIAVIALMALLAPQLNSVFSEVTANLS